MATPQDRINIGRQVDVMISRAKASGNAKNDLLDSKLLFESLASKYRVRLTACRRLQKKAKGRDFGLERSFFLSASSPDCCWGRSAIRHIP